MRNKTKIALIQLPYYKSTNSAVIPLGLIMLGTVAEQNGFRAEIIDLDLLVKQGKLNTTSKFFKSAAKQIIDSGADILGFSPICHSFPAALLVAKECKKLSPKKMIVFGGPEASFQDTETLRLFPFVDLIVRGEGERVLVELLNAVKTKGTFEKIKGITYRCQQEIIKNPDQELICNLDALPYPDYSLHPVFRNKGRLRYGVEALSVEGGRGCPYSCTFCSARQMWQGRFRLKSPRRLADEIKYITDNYGNNLLIEILHDNFTVNRKVLLQFCQYLPKGIIWRLCARIDLLDKTIIQKLSQSGCQNIFIGIESGSPDIQKSIHKNLNLDQAYKNILLINRSGIELHCTFVIGFPEEKAEDLNKTIHFALRCACLSEGEVVLYLLNLLAPSSLYQELGPNALTDIDSKMFINPRSAYITNSRQESDLINHHKSFFPSFSVVKSDHFDAYNMVKLYIIFEFLLQHLPLSTRATLRLLSFTPVELANKIIHYFEKTGLKRWESYRANSNLSAKYLKMIRKFIKSIGKESIQKPLLTLFEHEASMIKAAMSSNRKQDKPFLPERLTWMGDTRPYLSKGVLLKQYNYDLNHLINSIQAESGIEALATKKIMVAYLPRGTSSGNLFGNLACALKLSALAQLLIKLCDGKATAKQITQKAYSIVGEEIGFKQFSLACDKELKFLFEQGVLCVVQK